MQFLTLNIEYALTFFIVFARVLGFAVFTPFYGNRQVPVRLRIIFSMVISVFLIPLLDNVLIQVTDSFIYLFFLILINLMWGYLMGFVINMMFAGLQFGAEVYGFQSGFRIVNVIDPATEESISVLGVYHNIFVTLLFIALDGHRIMLYYLAESFYRLPLDYIVDINVLRSILTISSRLFVIGIQIGAPIIFAQLLLIVTIAVFGKAVPQIPIMIVSFPVKLIFGIGGLALILQYVADRFQYIMVEFIGYINRILMMAP